MFNSLGFNELLKNKLDRLDETCFLFDTLQLRYCGNIWGNSYNFNVPVFIPWVLELIRTEAIREFFCGVKFTC